MVCWVIASEPVPLATLAGVFLVSVLSNHSGYSDAGLLLLVAAYVMPVLSFLLGAAVYTSSFIKRSIAKSPQI
ncbi:hypothetical protein E3E36_02040 [Thermococcus sp. M36]|uniref:hypothetical protein n=1 Tax=Thermococcus sp. M36 TaxID=1638261 RepID=UPI00143ABEDC|nr:hypothetical protein [Thermococcus sp. M36]NJE04950.1 hypothetical protein [Thermococcus sp. M36]